MINILCYGDSNTYGCNPDWLSGAELRHDSNTRWTMVMQKLLGQDYNVIEEGLNGRTTVFEDPTMAGRCGLDFVKICVESHLPLDLVIIALGTNDTKAIFNATPTDITAGVTRLVREVLNPFYYFSYTAPQVLLACPAPIGEAALNLNDGITTPEMITKSKQLAPLYEQAAERIGCHFIDIGKVAKTSDQDGVHLTSQEHAKVAAAMAEKVKSIFEK